ncbi:MAG TPA: 6-aminohexanoate hydrolase [Herpetosiphon sp.]|uniref:6-aminohexanoate-dimer hydrolase n=1 Tax=Herpetosiphon aurantiacus (strain ATCC 23779 / DSM 785 / 114-95) TaxID=316274 RepID=A9B2R3_HERA2|nr:serine hydrolase [Herpetosiphon sp.]ABX05514.1 6-aminohexanoate-dimer hydrolase [Herpetosiphon aurantiacus DSM 785]HBW51173.1 6-aminohexanoate hydrolase [Herpetosiphon sp.]
MNQPMPQTASELGLMQGFPPASRVDHAQQLLKPYNRWSFQHIQLLNPVADVWRGTEPSSPFEYDLHDLDSITYKNYLGQELSFNHMVEQSYTDGLMVLHRGKVIYERYLNNMQPQTLHAWASGSKSVTGTLAALLVAEQVLDPQATVAYYLPELANSGFGDATLAHVLGMSTAVGFAEQTSNLVTENFKYGVALGWNPRPADYQGPTNVYEFLPTMLNTGEHGQRFTYQTPNTDVLAWIIKRVLNCSLAEAVSTFIWQKLGAERDGLWVVDSACAETAGSGFCSTLRDMARFGQMLLGRGAFNNQQILPEAAVLAIEAGGDQIAFGWSAIAHPSNANYSYNYQWWHTHNQHGAYIANGYGGQMLYIAPKAELVFAKMSSYPTPTADGSEFYAAMGAIPSLIAALQYIFAL